MYRQCLRSCVAALTLAMAIPGSAAPPVALIPQPILLELRDGSCTLTPESSIVTDAAFHGEAQLLADKLAIAMGHPWQLTVVTTNAQAPPVAPRIVLAKVPPADDLGEEGYRLDVTAEGVRIESATPAGAFYACQTLRQLLPAEIESPQPVSGIVWSLPQVNVVDRPRFAWRGMMLDSSRHFQDKATIKRFLDLLAYQKMNRLHWHLSDDQGWRVEITKYPRLTEIGAWRPNRNAQLNRLPNATDEHYGGYYSQADLREIVAYAAQRHIMIVPEVEMPGHCLAMIAAYPELCCTGKPVNLGGNWRTHDVCCVGNEQVFQFLDEVFSELVAIFPSPWIHIGGDECPKDRWQACPKCQARKVAERLNSEDELQSYFVRRVEKILEAKGRRLIGWDEILEGGLAPNATVQSWRSMKGGLTAARAGHDVVMSPTSHCYLDYTHQVTSTQKSYALEPIPEGLEAAEAHHILGVEGCMWLGVVSMKHLQRTGEVLPVAGIDAQLFPRLLALAEVAWSPKAARDWGGFRVRLVGHAGRLDRLGVHYTRDITVWTETSTP